ncbi:MAG: RNA methyltransferase [Anaerolineales bacterium]
MISSTQNPKIKRIRLLQDQSRSRKKENAFVIEGVRLLDEAVKTRQIPELVIYTTDLDSRGQQLVAALQKQRVPCEEVSREIIKAASDTESPQGILAILPHISLPVPTESNFIMIADEIRDPGNLGTLLRTSAAAGVNSLLVSPGTVDPFSPKVVRAAMGAHFRLPILPCSWEKIREITEGLTVFASDMKKGTRIWDVDLTAPLAIIIGGEARGLGKNASDLADRWLHIPMSGGTESLNAAAAGAVLMFEVHRQRTMEQVGKAH